MNLPNKITFLRMICVLIIILLALFPYSLVGIEMMKFTIANVEFDIIRVIILILFLFASFTDFLDGYLARKNNLVTTFGKFMDPIADKLLINTLFIWLTALGEIPVLVCMIMIGRDLVVDAIRMIMVEKQVVIAASNLGKLKTIVQIIAITMVLLQNVPFNLMNVPLSMILCWIAAAISLLSGIDYFWKNRTTLLEGMN